MNAKQEFVWLPCGFWYLNMSISTRTIFQWCLVFQVNFLDFFQDYIDAFEKLLHLNLKDKQEREIVHVVLHCCLQVSVMCLVNNLTGWFFFFALGRLYVEPGLAFY